MPSSPEAPAPGAARAAGKPEMLAVAGVRPGAVRAGIRYPDRRDLAAFVFAPGTAAAAVFTRNAFCAAPV